MDDDIYLSNDKLGKISLISNIKKKFPKVTSNNVTNIIKELEKQMFERAKNLEFEEAAKIRDQITSIQQKYLDMPKNANS